MTRCKQITVVNYSEIPLDTKRVGQVFDTKRVGQVFDAGLSFVRLICQLTQYRYKVILSGTKVIVVHIKTNNDSVFIAINSDGYIDFREKRPYEVR